MMANVKKGNLTAAGQRWKHLDWWKRVFWKGERKAQDAAIAAEAHDAWRRRGIDRRATVDAHGDTVWPDSETPNAEVTGLGRNRSDDD